MFEKQVDEELERAGSRATEASSLHGHPGFDTEDQRAKDVFGGTTHETPF